MLMIPSFASCSMDYFGYLIQISTLIFFELNFHSFGTMMLFVSWILSRKHSYALSFSKKRPGLNFVR